MLLNYSLDNINQTNNGNTALYIAAKNGHVHSVQLLLKAGADVNQTNNLKNTPLYIACVNRHNIIVLLLVHADAEVTDRDIDMAKKQEMGPILMSLMNAVD